MFFALLSLPLSTSSVGHIFVLNTDLRYLACDSWLCPVAADMDVHRKWGVRPCEVPEMPAGWGKTTQVVRCNPKTAAALQRRREERHRHYDHPQPYLGLVMAAGSGTLPVALRMATLHEFLAKVADDLKGDASRFGDVSPATPMPSSPCTCVAHTGKWVWVT